MKLLLFILGLLLGTNGFCQQPKHFIDFDKAVKVARDTNKPLMLLFTGSDWCVYCKLLESKVIHTPEFEKWYPEHVVFVVLDFPRTPPASIAPDVYARLKSRNITLRDLFHVRGFPTVVLVDPRHDQLKEIGRTGYQSDADSPKPWCRIVENILSNY